MIDVHGHVFPRFGTDSEGQAGELSLKFIQHHVQYHGQGWRRIRDGEPAQPDLIRPSGDAFGDMPDVDFRVGDYGRLECTVAGEPYFMQWYPCSFRDNAAPPELLLAYMNYMGVEMAVLQHDHVYGSLNRFLSECSRRFPGRFLPLAQIREWEADQPAQLERLEDAITNLGLRGLYFAAEAFGLTGWQMQLDDPKLEPLWAVVERLQVPVFWYLYTSQLDRFGGYMDQVDRLSGWARSHPAIRSVMTHGFETINFRRDPGRFELPRPIVDCIRMPNMHVEVMFHLMAPDTDYPFPWAQRALRELYEEVGPEKLLWGSDMPGTERSIAYKHAMDYVRLHADFMSDQDKALFFGGNAARVLGVAPRSASH